MFKQLHIRLTVFFTLVTGIIFLVLTSIGLFFAENSIRQSNHASFLAKLDGIILPLQNEDTISHQWLNQIQNGSQLKLYLYDNNMPLIYQNRHEQDDTLINAILSEAKNTYNMDIFAPAYEHISSHTEFTFQGEYEVSVGFVPNKNGFLSFIILSSLASQKRQLFYLQLSILGIDFFAIILLAIFSWYFTGRLLIPLSENQKKQTLFIASASHELRTPLAIILSGLESISKTNDLQMQAHFIDLITAEGHRMRHLIDDMLLLANADSKSLKLCIKPYQPDELLLHTYEIFEPLAVKKKIKLYIQLPEELLPDCYCDKERMIQVFSILTDNALCYTPAGGKIMLSLKYQSRLFIFEFSDTGQGIPDEEKPMIFDRFYRSSKSHTDKNHFGLGLCIAKEIITAHGGTIQVKDHSLGEGTSFIITLKLEHKKGL